VPRLEQLPRLALLRRDDAHRLEHLRHPLHPEQDVVREHVHRALVAAGPVVVNQEQPVDRVQPAVVIAHQQRRTAGDARDVTHLEAVIPRQHREPRDGRLERGPPDLPLPRRGGVGDLVRDEHFGQ
jgi:hypothetical protein